MKKSSSQSRFLSPSQDVAAFTLIELLAVMTIIVLLAALILGVANHANAKSALAKAQTEIKAFGTAIESYKVDHGIVPHDPSGSTDAVDPQLNFNPVDTKYREASRFLYRALSGFEPGAGGTVANKNPTKTYFNFQPTQIEIYPGSSTGTTKSNLSPDMYIVDPFGFSYGYSTKLQTEADKNALLDPPQPPPNNIGYNPTYDLWSTAGYASPGGKPTPSKNANLTQQEAYSNLWIKNW